jgi:hypothetical protein
LITRGHEPQKGTKSTKDKEAVKAYLKVIDHFPHREIPFALFVPFRG